MEKTTVFNLIIIDESGSMSGARESVISGCNETIDVAKRIQHDHSDAQNSFVSIYAFQSQGPVESRYICKNIKAEDAFHIDHSHYDPHGLTPMLDAIGSTIVDLQAIAATHTDATAVVTIITDGYENSSRRYSWQQVKKLISQVKELGWTVNFIGANIDVEKVADDLDIDSRMAFRSDASGTKAMFSKMAMCWESYTKDRISRESDPDLSQEEKVQLRKTSSKNFFRSPDKSDD